MLDVRLSQSGPIALDVSLHCAPGELLALVGPSGSGKTSVLRAIAGLLKVSNARIALGEQIWSDTAQKIDLPAQQRPVGMVFQQYALFPHLSALKNVQLAIARHHDPVKSLEIAHGLLRDMQLDGLAQRLPFELSGGQRQRVALARALAREPAVLLLDEAFSAVDQPTRHALYDELINLRERHPLPIVMVTHDLREARLLADRLCILEHGCTLQDGPPEHVMSHPRNARVAALVGLRDIHAGVFFNERGACLRWGDKDHGIVLETIDKGRLKHGTRVRWVISGEHVQLHAEPPVTPQTSVNVVPCEVLHLSRLGEVTTLKCRTIDDPHGVLHLDITTRLAAQMALGAEQRVYLQFDPLGIHIMPMRS